MNDILNDRIGFLPFNVVQDIYNKSKLVELNNVIEGFESDFFTISLDREDSLENYTLIYIGCTDKIKGLSLRSGRNIKDRDSITFDFSMAIEHEFPKKKKCSSYI